MTFGAISNTGQCSGITQYAAGSYHYHSEYNLSMPSWTLNNPDDPSQGFNPEMARSYAAFDAYWNATGDYLRDPTVMVHYYKSLVESGDVKEEDAKQAFVEAAMSTGMSEDDAIDLWDSTTFDPTVVSNADSRYQQVYDSTPTYYNVVPS